MQLKFRVSSAVLIFVMAVLGSAQVTTQSPSTDWQIGDVFAGVGRLDWHPGKYVVYGPDGTLKETIVDASAATITQKGSPIGITTGCTVAPSTDGYADALYSTSFYANRVMRFASTHPHAATLAATPSHPNLEAIESVVFDNQGNYYVSGLPPGRDSSSDPIPVNAYIFKYRRVGASDVLQATYTVPNGQRGADWLDLGSDQQTFYYTSEGTKIHEYRPGTTPFYREIQLRHPSGQIADGTAYAIRALPPVPGDPLLRPSGFLVAMHSGILRVAYDGPENDNTPADRDGVIVQGYDTPSRVGHYFALNITPDGQSFWTATFQLDFPEGMPAAGHLFKFHIASGALTKGPIPVQDSNGTRMPSVWGLCVKREYTAAANTCYVTDASGNAVLDSNGAPVTTVCRVPEVCDQAGIDEDGDGLDDASDPDCRNPGLPAIAVADKSSAEGELVDANHPANTQFPITVTDGDGGPLTITNVTGLPSFFTWSQDGTGGTAKLVITGTAPFGTLTANPDASLGYQIKIFATDGTHNVESQFRWAITRGNGPVSLTAPANRTCTVGLPCDSTFTVGVNEPDAEGARFTTIGLPAGFSHQALNEPNKILASGGLTNYPFLVTGPSSFSTTGTHTFNLCAVDEPVFSSFPIHQPVCISWTLTIVNQPPSIAVADQFTLFGTSDSYAVAVSDPDGHAVSVTSITGVPPGMSVVGNVISGTPSAVGTFVVTVTAQDAFGATTTTSFNWLVSNDNTPPVLNLPPSVTIDATSLNGAPHTFTASALDNIDGPIPVTCSATSGQTFPMGPTTVTCFAIDAAGNKAAGSFTVTVVDRTPPAGACTPSYNPSTKNIPKASKVNEDGFYMVSGSDAISGPVTITLGSYTLQNGETVKFTQSPGQNGVTFVNMMQSVRHFRVGSGDPVVTITDTAGNTTTVSCIVPPKKK